MRTIQWFPGHMTSAIRMMEDNLKLVDSVILVLDARAPTSSLNPKLDNLFKDKRVLCVMNKCDLIEDKDAKKTVSEFVKNGRKIITVSAFDKKSVDRLKKAIIELNFDMLSKYKGKGINRTLRVMVAGIPNTGKSSIINSLSGKKKAETGNKAGVTKSKQWVKLEGFELLDTPGTMPPYFEDQTVAKHLAYIGSINDDILDFDDLTLELIGELKVKYPELLKTRYKLESVDKENLEIYEDICKKRGYIFKNNEIDYERGANAIIDDFRKGRIGKIFLD